MVVAPYRAAVSVRATAARAVTCKPSNFGRADGDRGARLTPAAAIDAEIAAGTPPALRRRMRIRLLALSLLAVLTFSATPARADEVSAGKTLLAIGIVSDAGSLASGLACGTLFAGAVSDGLGEHYHAGRYDPNATIVSCSLNVGLGVAGIIMTAVGAKKLRQGRELQYSLNGVAARF
jgi:hypothetical protein